MANGQNAPSGGEAPGKRRTIDEVEVVISRILQVGVLTSAVITLLGLVLFLVTGRSGYSGDTFPKTLPAIFLGLLALKPYAIIMLGLFILILTPVFRVGVSILVFLKEKDTRFVYITGLVFVILIVSFLLGKAG